MMRRHSLWALIVMTLFAVTTVLATNAEAGRKKKRKQRKRAKVTKTANIKALRELMGAFKFGMSEDEVVAVVTEQIKERYAEQIAATNDVYQQDKLRTKQRREIKRLKKSRVSFEGKKGGWDVSIIDGQFAHRTEESMMVQWEIHQGRNQRRFFFFHDGELYKMFISLDTSNLAEDQRTFGFFRSLMEKRFGKGVVHDTGLSWHLRDIHVAALDKLAVYNAFCLVVTHPARAKLVAEMRADRVDDRDTGSAIIRTVTETVDDGGPDLDEGSDTLDRVLGNL